MPPSKLQREVITAAPTEPIPGKIVVVDPPTRRLAVKRGFERAAWIKQHRQHLLETTLNNLLTQYDKVALDQIPAADMAALLWLLSVLDPECSIDLSDRT